MLPLRLRRLPWAVALSGLAVWIGSVVGDATVPPPRAEAVVRLDGQGPPSLSSPAIQALDGPREGQWTLVATGPTETAAVEQLRAELERLRAQAAALPERQGRGPPRVDPVGVLVWLKEQLGKVLEEAGAPAAPPHPSSPQDDRSVRDIAALNERLRKALPAGHPWLRRVEETLGSLRRIEPERRGLVRLVERLPPSHPEARRLQRELASLSPPMPSLQARLAGPHPIKIRKAVEKLLAEIDTQLAGQGPQATGANPHRPGLQVVAGPKPVGGEPPFPGNAVPAAAALAFVAVLLAPGGRGRVRDPSDVPPGPWGEQVSSLPLLPTRAGAVSAVGRWVLAGLPWVLAGFSTLA